ncbi:cupin domain-containing protein [Deinococcus malanensis]|uniref:cupin domain-containing protein n=1 Tax=Deinococcus malanensis TaxID=1706855 RepID=UPI001E39254F|nr:cupin domain-containing protein [Deinococcus malanensis]
MATDRTSSQTPAGANVALNTKLENASAMEIVQLVLDFAPGAFTPSHTHGGMGLVSVMNGEITVREAGKTRIFKAGESWTEMPGVYAEVGNAGTAPARVLATFVLPKGAALTTTQQGGSNQLLPPGPTTVNRSNFEVAGMPAQYDLHQLILDFAPGAFTPEHTHGGPGFATVLAGQMVVRDRSGNRAFKAGETWREAPGEYAVVGNPHSAPARVAVSFMVPKGTALTTNRN